MAATKRRPQARKKKRPPQGKRKVGINEVSCVSGKKRYPTESIAEGARAKINAESPFMNLRSVYLCKRCQGWHTTSKMPRPGSRLS